MAVYLSLVSQSANAHAEPGIGSEGFPTVFARARRRLSGRGLLEPLGHVPPVEYEAAYYSQQPTPAMEAGLM